jgi:hypothetical protein
MLGGALAIVIGTVLLATNVHTRQTQAADPTP